MLAEFPNVDVFCVVDFLPEQHRNILCRRSPKTTFIQKIPFAKKLYKNLLPLMPLAIE